MPLDTPISNQVQKEADAFNAQRNAYLENKKKRHEALDSLLPTAEGYLQDDEDEPLLLFPDQQQPNRENPEKQRKYAANVAFDGLMDTLLGVTEYSAEQAKRLEGVDDTASQSYETTAQAMVPLVQVWSKLAQGGLPLTVDESAEEKYRMHNDKVYIYSTQQCELDKVGYQNVSVFIRPNAYEDPRRPKSPRATITVSPASSPNSAVTMRIEYDENEHANELTFDLDVGEDMIFKNGLRFPEASKNHNILQRQGHHFSTRIAEGELGVSFPELLEALVEKADENIIKEGSEGMQDSTATKYATGENK